jgi:hypothetical protein
VISDGPGRTRIRKNRTNEPIPATPTAGARPATADASHQLDQSQDIARSRRLFGSDTTANPADAHSQDHPQPGRRHRGKIDAASATPIFPRCRCAHTRSHPHPTRPTPRARHRAPCAYTPRARSPCAYTPRARTTPRPQPARLHPARPHPAPAARAPTPRAPAPRRARSPRVHTRTPHHAPARTFKIIFLVEAADCGGRAGRCLFRRRGRRPGRGLATRAWRGCGRYGS